MRPDYDGYFITRVRISLEGLNLKLENYSAPWAYWFRLHYLSTGAVRFKISHFLMAIAMNNKTTLYF